MFTLVGGTFNYFHKGHELMLKRAYETGELVLIGITTDEYANKNKSKTIKYESRKKNVENYMKKFTDNFEIHPLTDKFGETLKVTDANIVVSPETYKIAEYINQSRKNMGMKPLNIVRVPFVLAEDLFPISSTRIINREITRTGKRKNQIRITISTKNNLKYGALNNFLKKRMKNFNLIKNINYSIETEQPFGSDTMKLATERAMRGLEDNDYSVGVESGVFYNKINDVYYDFHYCSVIDRYSRITTGASSGFEIPDNIIELVKSGVDVSHAIENLYNIKDIGKKEGIIGIITDYNLKRYDLIYEAIRNAFLVRLRTDLYNIIDY